MENEIIEAIANSSTMAQAADSLNMPFTSFKRKAIELNLYNTNQGAKGTNKKPAPKYELVNILEGLHPNYATGHLKSRLIKAGYKKNECEECNIKEWNNKPLVCHLDHINGISNDHRLENLKMLCPNCHSQTPTYCGRNIKK